MQKALSLTRTTIGKKALVAVTGAILFGFVIAHLAGNLLLFAGPEAYNGYAATLKGNPPLLWGTRITLLASVVTHVVLTIQLAGRNAAARAQRYQHGRRDLVTTYAARTMALTGPLILAFILFHLAHYTAPGLSIGGQFNHEDVYGNVVQSFRVWWVTAIYVFANAMLGLHLFHGAWSVFQSLGSNDRRYNQARKRAAIGLALFVSGGNVAIPLLVLGGVGVQPHTFVESPTASEAALAE
jgi:succinate dehydrogenase / fumarate reductase cytochrome b subunit